MNEVDPSGRAAIGDCGEAIFVLVNTGFGIAEGGLQLLSTLGPIVDVFGTIAWSGGSLSGELPFGGPPNAANAASGRWGAVLGLVTGTGDVTATATGVAFLADGTICGFSLTASQTITFVL